MSKGKIIVGIHGLGNKPPKDILSSWWKAAIIEGLRKNNLVTSDFDFEMAYWADVLNEEPLNPAEANSSHSHYVYEKYLPEGEQNKEEDPVKLKQKATDYLEKYYGKFLINEIISLKHPTLTDAFVYFNLRELKIYFSLLKGKYSREERLAREVMMSRFIEILRRNKGKEILIIAHSMGAIIAHDVLLEIDSDISIETLITIGSPLGQQYIVKNYQQESEKKRNDKFITPPSIKKAWYNYSDKYDLVAIEHFLGETYKENENKVKVVDQLVNNDYIIAGYKNPHTAFGYLRTGEVANNINEFLQHKKTNIFSFIKLKHTS